MSLLVAPAHPSSRAGASMYYFKLVLCGSPGDPTLSCAVARAAPLRAVLYHLDVTSYLHDCQAQLQLPGWESHVCFLQE